MFLKNVKKQFALNSIVVRLLLVPAKLTNVISGKTVHEGSNLQLFCEASGNPKPNITWTKMLKDGSSSKVMHYGSTWNFTNINRNDSGTYKCTANNGFGNPVSRAINVDVACEYIHVQCTYSYVIMLYCTYYCTYLVKHPIMQSYI